MVKKEKVSVFDMIIVAKTEALISLKMSVSNRWNRNRDIAKRYGVKHDFYARTKKLVRFSIKRLKMIMALDSITMDYLKGDAFTHKHTIRYS